MKKNICFILLCMLFLYGGKVVAVQSACSYSEQAKLNSEFANIKITYESEIAVIDNKTGKEVDIKEADLEKEGNEIDGYYTMHFLKISILNMSDNFKVEVTNDKNSAVKNFTFDNAKNGVITYYQDSELIEKIVNHSFTFITTDKTECPGENYGTKKLTTPRYNQQHEIAICKENPDVDACQTFVTFEDEGIEKFHKLLSSQISEVADNTKDDKTVSNSFMDFIKNNKEAILIALGALALIVAAAIVVNKTKKRRGAL